jgi:hypothetical protein
MHAGRRWVAGGVVPVAIVTTAVVPWLLAWSDLPNPVATHWGATGRPDDSTSPLAAVALGAVPTALAALVLAGSILGAPRPAGGGAGPARPRLMATAAMAAALGGLFAVLSAATVVANAGEPTWRDADLRLGLVLPVATIGMAVPALLASWALIPAGHAGTVGRAAARGGSERVAWAETCHARWPVLPAGALAVVAAVVAATEGLWLGAYLALAALAVLAVGTVHVTAGVRGVRAVPPTTWPGVRIPLDRIASARAIDLHPMRWGGWGYRGSLRFTGRAAWVLRAGPALELTLVDGRVFAVTIDGAGEAAAVVTELVAGNGGRGDG